MERRLIAKLFYFVVLLASLSSCHKKYQALDSSLDQSLMKFENQPLSQLTIDASINRENLNRFVNTSIEEILAKQSAVNLEGFDVRFSKYDEVNVGLTGKTVSTKLPINLSISKDVVIGKITAKGALQLFLSTEINIDEYWNLSTITKVIDYEWLEPLKLVSGFGISLESMANNILDSSIDKITNEIDQQIRSKVSLPNLLRANMHQIEGPFALAKLSKEKLNIAWSDFTVEPATNSLGNINLKLGARAAMQLNEQSTKRAMDELPSLAWQQMLAGERNLIKLPLNLSMDSLNNIIKEKVVGQVLDQGNKRIKIEAVSIAEKSSMLYLSSLLSGDYNGTMEMACRPLYDAKANKFNLNELSLKFTSKNKLKQVGLNLFKGRIKKEIEKSILLELDGMRDMLKPLINQQLASIEQQRGVKLMLDLDKIELGNFFIKNQQVNALILVDTNLKVHVEDLYKLAK